MALGANGKSKSCGDFFADTLSRGIGFEYSSPNCNHSLVDGGGFYARLSNGMVDVIRRTDYAIFIDYISGDSGSGGDEIAARVASNVASKLPSVDCVRLCVCSH